MTMTNAILEELNKTLTQVKAELSGKMDTQYNKGYADGVLRVCEAVQKATKEMEDDEPTA